MNIKSRHMIIFLMAILVVLNGCDMYNQLYGQQKSENGTVFVPIEQIKTEKKVDNKTKPPKELFPPQMPEKKDNKTKGAEVKDGKAIVVIAQETELINLQPDASDPDNDKLQFFFTKPLNEMGQWKTTYGDAGEYTVTLTASDGTLSTTKDVLIIVNRKEEVPTIDEAAPAENVLQSKENMTVKFSIRASDLNKDTLAVSWKLDGKEVSTKTSYDYSISFNDAGSHTLKAEVSDGKASTTRLWSITVANVNRAPILDAFADMIVKETETVSIKPKATDPDGDKLIFSISEPVGDSGVWKTDYDDAGIYVVKVTASDGTDKVTRDVNVKVENVNRPPVITGVIRK